MPANVALRPSKPPRLRRCSPLPSRAGVFSLLLLLLFAALAAVGNAAPPPTRIDLNSPRYQGLLAELIDRHGFSIEELLPLFTGLEHDPKVLRLITTPGEAKPYPDYRRLFLNGKTIAAGRNSLAIQRPLFDRIEEHYGVDREVIVAIWAIESRFGTNTGGFDLFRTLNTLFDGYPRRSDFFRGELIEFLLLCRANGIDPLQVKGSYAGAFGQAQFMPSSFNRFAVDFDHDGHTDLIRSLPDIFASIANYLAAAGWHRNGPLYAELGERLYHPELVTAYQQGRSSKVDWQLVQRSQKVKLPRPPENLPLTIIGLEQPRRYAGKLRYLAGYPNFQAITEYNHSNKYAMVVSELAEALAEDR